MAKRIASSLRFPPNGSVVWLVTVMLIVTIGGEDLLLAVESASGGIIQAGIGSGFFTAILLFLLLPVGKALATTYYVRTSGNDGNAGTSAGGAWRTVVKAVTSVSAGDTVYIGAGTYTEEIKPDGDGTSGNPIRIVADTDGAQTGDAGIVTLAAKSDKKAIDSDGEDYWEFNGFTVTGSNKETIKWKNATGVVLRDLTISSGKQGMKIEDADADIYNCAISGGSDVGIEIKGVGTVVIEDSTISGMGSSGIEAYDDAGTNLTVRRTLIENCSDHGIHVDLGTFSFTNCLITGNTMSGVMIYAKDETAGSGTDVTLMNCTIADNDDDGILCTEGTLTVTNSIIASNGKDGLEKDGGTFNHTYNLVWGNSESDFDGLTIDTSELSVDPKLSDSTYRPCVVSDVVDAGTDTGAPTDDIEGTTRPIGDSTDMGAYEVDATVTTYYVQPNGSDSNDGTGIGDSDAWQTVHGALTNADVRAQDIIYVKTGTYTEAIVPTVSGDECVSLSIIADRDGVIFGGSGGDVTLMASSGNEAIDMDSVDYLHFIGFRIDGTDGGSGKHTVLLYDCGGVTFDQCEIVNGAEAGIRVSEGSGLITIVNCLIHDQGGSGITVQGSISSCTVINSTIAHNDGDGIELYHGTNTVTNCILAYNGDDGLDKDAGNLTHTYNVSYSNSGSNFEGTTKGGTESESDPKFVDADGRDYQLDDNSAATNFGTATGAPDDDIDGVPRPIGGAHDAGAYEYPLVGHWRLDDGSGTTATDATGNGNDGTLTGGPTWDDDGCRITVDFDGSNDYIDVGNDSTLQLTDELTLSAWVKTSTVDVEMGIAGKRNAGYGFALSIDASNKFRFHASGGGTDEVITGNEAVADGGWHHVVGMRRGGANYLFVDGVRQTETGSQSLSDSGEFGFIGRLVDDSTANSFDGLIDDIRLYGYGRSDKQISALFGLVGHWKLNETSGTTADDDTAYQNDGTLQGSPVWRDENNVVDGALDFFGTSDYVTMTQQPEHGTGPFSVSIWARPRDLSSNNTTYGAGLIRSTTGENIGDFFLSVDDDGAIHFANWRSAGNDADGISYTADGALITRRWRHVVAVWDGSTNKVYVDGVDQGALSTEATSTGWLTENSLGRNYTSSDYHFDGPLDDARIYSRALCPDEVTQLYNRGGPVGVRIIEWIEAK